MVGKVHVVVVQVRDIAPARNAYPFVVGPRLLADILRQVDERDAWVAERRDNGRGIVGAVVPHDNEFPVGKR
jgi:hypothetical protein